MGENQIENQIEEYAELESNAIDNYIEKIYSKKVPEPVPPSEEDNSFFKIAGIEAILFTISGIGIVIYSSIRTGGLFFIMEKLLLEEFKLGDALTQVFSSTSMITSLLAFELFVLADGFSKGKSNEELKRSNFGLYSALGVIVLAGIFSAMGFFPSINENIKLIFYLIIAVGSAVASGIIALASGENIGFTFTKVENTRKKLKENHKLEYQSWREAGIKAYNSSHYAIGSKKSSEFFSTLSTLEKDSNVKEPVIEANKTNDKKQSDVEKNRFSNLSKTEQAYELIEKFVKEKNRIPSTKEISELGYSIGTVSIVRNRYILNNSEWLLKNKIITNELYAKAKQSVENKKGE